MSQRFACFLREPNPPLAFDAGYNWPESEPGENLFDSDDASTGSAEQDSMDVDQQEDAASAEGGATGGDGMPVVVPRNGGAFQITPEVKVDLEYVERRLQNALQVAEEEHAAWKKKMDDFAMQEAAAAAAAASQVASIAARGPPLRERAARQATSRVSATTQRKPSQRPAKQPPKLRMEMKPPQAPNRDFKNATPSTMRKRKSASQAKDDEPEEVRPRRKANNKGKSELKGNYNTPHVITNIKVRSLVSLSAFGQSPHLRP